MKRITTLITILIVLCTAPITTFAAADKLAQEPSSLTPSGDKTPLTIIGGQVNAQRTYYQSTFDTGVPVDVNTLYIDEYQKVPVTVSQPATVSVSILDANRQFPVTLVPAITLAAGDYTFSLDLSACCSLHRGRSVWCR